MKKQSESSTVTIQPSPLNQHHTALTEKQPLMPDSQLLNVPLINQMDDPRLYNGCEVTSLAMLLNYSGFNVTKSELADNIMTVPLKYGNGLNGNPNEGFVGDIADGPGFAVYNGPIFNLAREYARDRAVNLTNYSFTDILKRVGDGQPVWVITSTSFAPVSDLVTWATPQGTIKATFSEHSVVITGYDKQHIYVNDPYGCKDRKVDRNNFRKVWEQMGSQAIVINP